MSIDHHSHKIERLTEKLGALKDDLLLDTEEAVKRFEEHRQHVQDAIGTMPEKLHGLEDELAEETAALKRQLGELDVQMALARMEAEDVWRQRSEAITRTLSAFENTVRRIEQTEDREGLLHLKNFAAQIRKLEDRMHGLHVHYSLRASHAAEDFARERKALAEMVADLLIGIEEVESHDTELLKAAGDKIKKASTVLWDVLKEFFQYLESDEERRERERREQEVVD